MKITSSEEYGMRILIRIASANAVEGLSIPQLSDAEGLSVPHVAKLCRILRMEGFINSTPGQKGGYVLAKPSDEIIINEVLQALGGILYNKAFCEVHKGVSNLCTNSVDCSVRSLWSMVQNTLDNLLNKLTLKDLTINESQTGLKLQRILDEQLVVSNI